MGHARRKQGHGLAVRGAHHRSSSREPIVDARAVEEILEWRVGADDGDPVRGIRNALLASAVFWTLLGAAFLYLS